MIRPRLEMSWRGWWPSPRSPSRESTHASTSKRLGTPARRLGTPARRLGTPARRPLDAERAVDAGRAEPRR